MTDDSVLLTEVSSVQNNTVAMPIAAPSIKNQPITTSMNGLNLAHGQLGHSCAIPVGARLSELN